MGNIVNFVRLDTQEARDLTRLANRCFIYKERGVDYCGVQDNDVVVKECEACVVIASAKVSNLG